MVIHGYTGLYSEYGKRKPERSLDMLKSESFSTSVHPRLEQCRQLLRQIWTIDKECAHLVKKIQLFLTSYTFFTKAFFQLDLYQFESIFIIISKTHYIYNVHILVNVLVHIIPKINKNESHNSFNDMCECVLG